MVIDPQVAAALGFPKTKYLAIERERRWLCRDVPRARIVESQIITDLYVTGTQLRLRDSRAVGGGPPMLRLTRKADIDSNTRLLTSIYLREQEFAVLAAALAGVSIKKIRHRVHAIDDTLIVVDEFHGALAGLILAEAEFETPEAMASFAMPDFATREVTDDARYSGVSLAWNGRPPL